MIRASTFRRPTSAIWVSLQRTFIQTAKDPNWANEVPVASGVAGTRSDSEDFVHQISSCNEYSVIELKWPRTVNTNETPLRAAIQVLRYGLSYIFSRTNALGLGYESENKPILDASKVHLRVLGPHHFYSRYLSDDCWLEKLEKSLDLGISGVAQENGLEMAFAFEQFPEEFAWNPEDRFDVGKRVAVIETFQNRRRLFPVVED